MLGPKYREKWRLSVRKQGHVLFSSSRRQDVPTQRAFLPIYKDTRGDFMFLHFLSSYSTTTCPSGGKFHGLTA